MKKIPSALTKVKSLYTKYYKNNIRVSIITSFILLLLFVLFSIYAIQTNTTKLYDEKINKSINTYLDFSSYTIDSEIQNLNNLVIRYISLQYSYTSVNSVNLFQSFIASDSLYTDIKNITDQNRILDDIIILFHNKSTLFNKSGQFSLDYFKKEYPYISYFLNNEYTGYDTMNYIPYFEKTAGVSNNNRKYHTYVMHYKSSSYSVIFFIDYEKLSKLIALNSWGFGTLDSNNSALYIADNKDLCIFQSNSNLTYSQINGLISNSKNQKPINIDNERYIIFSKISEKTNFKYSFIYPYKDLKKEIFKITLPYQYLYIVIILLFVCMLILIRKKIKNPLKFLIENYLPSDDLTKDEFVSLEGFIELMQIKSKEVDSLTDKNIAVLQKNLLNDLVFNSISISNSDIETYFMKFSLKYLSLVKVIVYNNNSSACENMINLLIEKLQSLNNPMNIFSISTNRLYFVMNFNGEIEYIYNKLSTILNDDSIALVTTEVDSINKLSVGYEEISVIQKFRNINPIKKIYSISDVNMETNFKNNYFKIIDSLKNAIIGGKKNEAISLYHNNLTLSKSNSSIKEAEEYLLFIKKSIDQICETKNIHNKRMENELFTNIILGKDNPDLCFVNVFDAERVVLDYIEEICDYIEYLHSKEDDEIIQYIKENFNNYISLKLVAEKFEMNANYLSVYIKKQLGMTYNEYINSLRLQQAKKLLMETEISIGEIAESMSFDSPSSFIRFFKKSVMMTPKQYREENTTVSINKQD